MAPVAKAPLTFFSCGCLFSRRKRLGVTLCWRSTHLSDTTNQSSPPHGLRAAVHYLILSTCTHILTWIRKKLLVSKICRQPFIDSNVLCGGKIDGIKLMWFHDILQADLIVFISLWKVLLISFRRKACLTNWAWLIPRRRDDSFALKPQTDKFIHKIKTTGG